MTTQRPSQPDPRLDAGLASVPSQPVVWAVMAVIAFGVVVGLYLLIAPAPTLPNERERTGGAPPPLTPLGPTAAATAAPATPAATATRTPTTAPVRRYTIRPGDTLLSIATQFDTTVDAIRAANPGLNETALPVGIEITIPSGR